MEWSSDTPRKSTWLLLLKILLFAGYNGYVTGGSTRGPGPLVLGVGVQSFTGLPFGKRLQSFT